MKSLITITRGALLIYTISLLCTSFVEAVITSQVETSASAGQPGAEAFDADLAFQVSNSDFLHGVTPTLTPAAAVFGSAPITDGGGPSRDFSTDSTGASFLADGPTVIEWTGLGSITINEIRVFGYGVDDRSLMEYTIEVDSGSGYTLIDTVDNGSGGPVGVSNGTNLVRTFDDTGASLATGVVGIRIVYQDNFAGGNGAAIGEIDVIGSVPPPLTGDGIWTNLAGGGWESAGNWSSATIASGIDKTARFDTLNLVADATVTLDSSRPLGHLIFGDIIPSNDWYVKIDNPYQPLTLSGTTPSIEVINGTTSLEVQLTGNQGLEKKGAGILELNRPNTYTGTTKVSAGTLLLSPALKIMPFGDSITYGGGGSNAGYRGYLYTLLNPILPKFEFEGASSTNPSTLPASPVNQRSHNGYASYPTLTISNNLDGLDNEAFNRWGGVSRDPHGGYWIVGGNGTGRNPQYPDIALCMIGANDIFWSNSGFNPNITIDKYDENMRALVDKLQTLRPDCHVIIARITPWPAQSANVTILHSKVDTVVADLLALGRKVSKVDLHAGFPPGQTGLADGLHPNNLGYEFMAGKWFTAIQEVLPYILPENSSLEVMSGASLIAKNQRISLDSITGAGSIDIDGSSLSVGGSGATSIFAGVITGNGSLSKLGAGTITLTGNSAYEGDTHVAAGVLAFSQATLNDGAKLSITPGATLHLAHDNVDTVGVFEIGGVVMADGVYGSMASDAPNKTASLTGMGKIRVGNANYSAWSTSNAGGQSYNLDFDHDGIVNGVEFFFGNTGSSFTSNPQIMSGSITWPRDSSALVSGFKVQYSDNLVDWIDIPHDDAQMTITASSVSYELPISFPMPARRFYRLMVTP